MDALHDWSVTVWDLFTILHDIQEKKPLKRYWVEEINIDSKLIKVWRLISGKRIERWMQVCVSSGAWG